MVSANKCLQPTLNSAAEAGRYAAFDAVVLDGRRAPRDRRWQSKRRRIQMRRSYSYVE
jgi:hypothetical protein